MALKNHVNHEEKRLKETKEKKIPWKKWGPYLSERQWGTVREDYSSDGNAWDYFNHDQSRSRAYRWGEDGLGGISDEKQNLCFALALWNGQDGIIKERLFGLTNSEGNHGEDVKEYYYYLDSTPTHSYMKYLYKYPQDPFPYGQLIKKNRELTRHDFEYELINTGVFDRNRYFDAFVEYAKKDPEEILIKITIHNRGDIDWNLHVMPTLWFRNTWSWTEGAPRPELKEVKSSVIKASHPEIGERYLYCEGSPELLFTENETNMERIFNRKSRTPYVKDGINNYVVHCQKDAVNPQKRGTKASPYYLLKIPAGGSSVIRLCLSDKGLSDSGKVFEGFDEIMKSRVEETDEFYASISPPSLTDDEKNVMRQALAGMLWSKQFFNFDLDIWLKEHGVDPFKSLKASGVRNSEWHHMINEDVISMPDKWEYPWYAAWDLAFHTLALGMVDIDFAKSQLALMLKETYLHPHGQIPAYEWNFSDVNPPVHPWATIYLYRMEKELHGKADLHFLKQMFTKLMLNFSWWINKKDRGGKNLYEGGFLGLDNIGIFDRSSPLPTGGYLEQADATGWVALFAQNMIEIGLELAMHDPSYEDMVVKFVEHLLWIGNSIYRLGEHSEGMWDEEEGFFYDVLRLPDGSSRRMKVRSIVGLLPLCATTTISAEMIEKLPNLLTRAQRRVARLPELKKSLTYMGKPGFNGNTLISLIDEGKLRRILEKLLDENEFLSTYGIRALSRYHLEHPYIVNVKGQEYRVDYVPAESDTGMFGGNSNWRGPIWFPMNLLVIRGLLMFYHYFGNDFKVECPTGSGIKMNLFEVTMEIARRLSNVFLKDEHGFRPVFGGMEKFQNDPHFRDYLLFYEYFHGDNGAGIGASHQTGWTGLVARLIQTLGFADAETLLSGNVRGISAYKKS